MFGVKEGFEKIRDHLQGKRVEKSDLARLCIAAITFTALNLTPSNPTYTDYVREPEPLPPLSQSQMIEAIESAIDPGYAPMSHVAILRTCLTILERQFC